MEKKCSVKGCEGLDLPHTYAHNLEDQLASMTRLYDALGKQMQRMVLRMEEMGAKRVSQTPNGDIVQHGAEDMLEQLGNLIKKQHVPA